MVDRNLLNKFFSDKCSIKESKEVLKWMNSFESRKDFELEFSKLWTEMEPLASIDLEKALNELNEKLEMDELIQGLHIHSDQTSMRTITKPLNQTKRLSLGLTAAVVSIVFIAGVVFSVYHNITQKEDNSSLAEYISRTTEPGQKLTLHLEDGSKVILNSSSTLIYPQVFSDSSRDLKLIGEAFFEVAKDTLRPFSVNSGNLDITALGTSFNIMAYPDQTICEVALATGNVQVQGNSPKVPVLILNPGEKVIFDTQEESISIGKIDPMKSFAWKDGIIYFKNADFQEIKSTLERWFGVEIHVYGEHNIGNWHFSGKFEKETLKNILEVLKFSYDFDYSLERKEVHLKI